MGHRNIASISDVIDLNTTQTTIPISVSKSSVPIDVFVVIWFV